MPAFAASHAVATDLHHTIPSYSYNEEMNHSKQHNRRAMGDRLHLLVKTTIRTKAKEVKKCSFPISRKKNWK